jgi:hypothetical protein
MLSDKYKAEKIRDVQREYLDRRTQDTTEQEISE